MTLATVDRLVHHSTIFEMKLGSYRRRTAIVAGPDSAPMARSTSASSATSASLYQRANGRRATGRAVVLDQRLHSVPACNHPLDPGPAAAAQALQAGQYGAAIGARQPPIVEALENGLDPRTAARVAGRRLELHHLRTGQYLTHLLQRPRLGLVQVDHHRFDDRLAPSARCLPATRSTTSAGRQDHSSLECGARLHALTSLDKTAGIGALAELELDILTCGWLAFSTYFSASNVPSAWRQRR